MGEYVNKIERISDSKTSSEYASDGTNELGSPNLEHKDGMGWDCPRIWSERQRSPAAQNTKEEKEE